MVRNLGGTFTLKVFGQMSLVVGPYTRQILMGMEISIWHQVALKRMVVWYENIDERHWSKNVST